MVEGDLPLIDRLIGERIQRHHEANIVVENIAPQMLFQFNIASKGYHTRGKCLTELI
jgi:hypothetical protein